MPFGLGEAACEELALGLVAGQLQRAPVGATATARLSATTGDGHTRSSASYSSTICGQSVRS